MIVIDTSAAVGMVRSGDPQLFESVAAMGQTTLAPEFFCIEAAQTAWKFVHVGALDPSKAATMLRATVNCVDELVDNGNLIDEALSEASRLDHSVYDMMYLVLARRTASPLLTCDRKLAALCEAVNVECIQLADLE